MKDAKQMLTDFLAEEKKEEEKNLEAVLKRAEEEAKNKSLVVEIKYDKPVLKFFNLHTLVALIASDYLDKDGKQDTWFREEDGAGVTKRVVDMKIDDFLGMAEPIPEDDENRHGSMARRVKQFLSDVVSGHTFNWAIPTLTIRRTEDGNWKVSGHDGRHRARLLKKIGYEEMPVCIQFKDKEGKDFRWWIPYPNSDKWTETVYVQNDTFAPNRRKKYNFPITKENCYSYYSRAIDLHRELCDPSGAEPECCCEAADCDIMKKTAQIEDEYLKGAPKECLEAKKVFEKDKEQLTKIPVPPIEMKTQNMQELLAEREKKEKSEKKD